MTPGELPGFPGYTNVSLLGTGGFADVYRARREGPLDRWVAIKLFRVTLRDPDAAAQFRAECGAIMRLDNHPDVLRVHDADFLSDGHPYLVSELCGKSLLQLVAQRGGVLPPDEVASIGYRIATALDAAHFARVLHGDVTPQNILLRASGDPVLADFGLAVLRDHRGNSAAGFNPAHAAPETLRHDGAIDARSDVYGLGSTLFTALTGQPPFPLHLGEPETARTLRILREPPPRPSNAPDWFADLLARMLAKEAEGRPSAAEVAGVLSGDRRSAAAFAPSTPAMPRADPEPSYAAPSNAAPPYTGPSYPAPPRSAAPPGPGYAPPPGFAPAADSQVHTRGRAGAPAPPSAPVTEGDHTRMRNDRPAGPASTDPRPAPGRRRPAVLITAAVLAVAALGVGAVVLLRGPVPDVTGSPVTGSRIELADPEDAGSSVTLRWNSDAVLDYGVVVAVEGRPADTMLADRNTTITLPIDPVARYCFQIQGSDGRGGVAESNIRSIRGAVCRFDQP